MAIDPGPKESAYVAWDGRLVDFGIRPNADYLSFGFRGAFPSGCPVVIEKVECYGMPVGETIFETVFFTGRLAQHFEKTHAVHRIPRRQVKLHICGTCRAKDANIRQALIDRIGEPGTKKAPGPTYGLRKDLWQALALAVTFWDKQRGVI